MRSSVPSLPRVALFAFSARALVRLRLDRLAAVLEWPPVSRALDVRDVARAAEVVERALAWRLPLVRHTCLTRGVTRFYFLRRAGANVQLVFGLGWVDGTPQGHCWIVLDGEVYREDSDPIPTFTSIYAIPGDGRG